jgi:hypothetical protein
MALMIDEPLFDLPGLKRAPVPEVLAPSLSPDQRRTKRQYDALLQGQHPLGVTLNTPLPLHPDAASAEDPQAEGLRCGTCQFRQPLGHHTRSYPKCQAGDGARVSHGAGTDVRAWWPACRDYQPKEEPS